MRKVSATHRWVWRVSGLRLTDSRLIGTGLAAAALLTACVTINVYFPAAEAQQAAKEFVDKVINPDAPATQPDASGGGKRPGFSFISLIIPDANAQSSAPDISIKTPAIQAIQSRMAQRFDATLRGGFDSGALGFTNDGLIDVRDAGKIALKDRVGMNQAVADDNRDRKAVYREIAVANGHPEWEKGIHEAFSKQWIASAHGGWWYQDASGAWKQK
ncbi:MAG: YdbL family protein [Lysobacteraceae bacterium]